MTEVFFSVLKLVQLLSGVIERQDFPAGITGKEEALFFYAPVVTTAAFIVTRLSSFSRIILAGSNVSISVTAGDNMTSSIHGNPKKQLTNSATNTHGENVFSIWQSVLLILRHFDRLDKKHVLLDKDVSFTDST